MSLTNNPYAKALEGLELDDPVKAFFDFCKERESIRVKRERGDPPPWTSDPVFQRGRFLNVFREDDRGTKALFKFVRQVKIYILLVAAICRQRNQQLCAGLLWRMEIRQDWSRPCSLPGGATGTTL